MSTSHFLRIPHSHSESSPYTPHYRTRVPRSPRHTAGASPISAARTLYPSPIIIIIIIPLLALPIHARHRAITHIREPPELLHLTAAPQTHHRDRRCLQRAASIRLQTIFQRLRAVHRDLEVPTSHPRGNPTGRRRPPRCRTGKPTHTPG